MADRIEEIMMEAYAYGIHHEVFQAVKTLQHDHKHDLANAYELAFQQTLLRYEHTNLKD